MTAPKTSIKENLWKNWERNAMKELFEAKGYQIALDTFI